ncbi:MAG: hypothetical protein Q9218_003036 [Villophora microphyllina]
MSLLKTINLAHVPEETPVHIAFYENVKNAGFLQQQLLDGNSAFEYAFIDASVILSSTHVLAAVFRAVNDWRNGRMKSKNVHSEIVFCLTIKVSTSASITADIVQQHLSGSVEGAPLPFDNSQIARFTDLAKVQKIYKLTSITKGSESGNSKRKKAEPDQDEAFKSVNGTNGKEDAERKRLEMKVLGLMALRGAT